MGAVPSPFDCFLVLRGLKTLPVRMERHVRTARQLATWLESARRGRARVLPGPRSHPQHALAKAQMAAPGRDDLVRGARAGCRRPARCSRRVRIFVCAESLGGVESLIEHPALMTHGSIPGRDARRDRHQDGLIRISVGLEAEQRSARRSRAGARRCGP